MVAAPFSMTDCSIWVAGYDMTQDSNKLTVASSVDELDVTTFGGGGYRTRIGGLRDVEAAVEGFQTDAAGAVGPTLFPLLGTADEAWTASDTGVAGAAAQMFQAGKFQVGQFGDVGAASPFSVAAKGTNSQGLVRGKIAKAKGNVSGTGVLGTGYQLGTVSATQYLYGTVHVFSAGTTITIVLESDDNGSFSSATTRATIGPLTAAGGTWVTRVAGAITDDYYRYRITVCTGTFSVGAAFGIAA